MSFTPREPIKVIADILAHELPLASGYITLNDEKWNIPKDNSLFIALSYIGPNKVISNVNRPDMSVTPPKEIQEVTALDMVQIDFMSYDGSARSRKHEIAMALASYYSQQLQEQYQCQIARMPAPIVDTSSLEATGMLKRFTTTISVTALYSKTKDVPYYETFAVPEVVPNE